MSAIPKLLEGLRSILHRRGLGYRDLARRLKVSESTVKRIFSRGSVSVARLEAICRLLEIDFLDLAKECKENDPGKDVLSSDQGLALAADPMLLAVLHLLLNEWTVDRISAIYEFEEPELVSLLAKLDRLGLIYLKPHNVVKLRVSPRMSWGRQEAVRARYERMVREEFLGSGFDKSEEVLRFEVRELTRGSIVAMQDKIDRLVVEIQELADKDATRPSDSKSSIGCLVAARPWVFSVLASLKRRELAAQQASGGK